MKIGDKVGVLDRPYLGERFIGKEGIVVDGVPPPATAWPVYVKFEGNDCVYRFSTFELELVAGL